MPIETTTSDNIDLYPNALAALRKLQADTVDWKTRVLTFGLSLLAFTLVGWLFLRISSGFTFASLIILTLMLLIHEAGHYVAMYLFGYRNLKMFFIPLLGAVVSGQKCVPVFKESIVYLLGPVPGIFLGYTCGLIFLITQNIIWRESALIFIVINALNLLPIYPLDGGRFIFVLLPHKLGYVQWLLQIIVTIIILIGPLFLDFQPMGFFGGLVLGSIWHIRRINRMVKVLLAKITEIETDVENMPDEAERNLIMTAIDESISANPKHIAQIAWEVWTRAKAKRPSVKEAFLLVTAYLGTWLSLWYARSIYLALMK